MFQVRVEVCFSSSSSRLCFKFFQRLNMPLRITPSKKPLPVGKRSSLRNKSYEVVPAPGRKVYLSDDIPVPVRPPPLSDADAAALFSRSQVRSDPATGTSPLMSDSVQPPPEVAPDSMESIDPSWQIATSRRSARTLRRVASVINTVVMHDDIVNPPPVSAATSSVSTIDASTPASAATFSVSTVQAPTSVECPSVGLPTSVADSTSVLSIPSSDAIPVSMVNPTSVVVYNNVSKES